jgi:hypothetical protein
MKRDWIHRRTQDKTTFMLNDYVICSAIEFSIDQYIFGYVYKDRIIERGTLVLAIDRIMIDVK